MTVRVFFLMSILSMPLLATANGEVDDPEVTAAIAVLDAKHDIERHHRFCRLRAGEYGYKYDYIKYLWDLKNRLYLQLSEKIFAGLPTSASKDLKRQWRSGVKQLQSTRGSADNDDNGRYCTEYFTQISPQDLRGLRETLMPRLGSTEEVRILQRDIDMEVGCVKAGYNKDVKQFEGIKQACDCQTSLVVEKLSSQEIDDYLALVGAKQPQQALAFIGERVPVEELQACYSQLGTR